MATNEIFAPNGPHNKMSLPVTSKADAGSALNEVKSGRPVMVGAIVGVAQTTFEATDGAATGIVNSNAPGNVTVWNGGTWYLDTSVEAKTAVVGSVVYAKAQSGTSVVTLITGTPATANGGNGDVYPFGTLYIASTAGDKRLAVRVNEQAGTVLAVSA